MPFISGRGIWERSKPSLGQLRTPGQDLFLINRRAGLRVSEALALEARDLSFDGELPSLRIRRGKGARVHIVSVHAELQNALFSAL